MCVFYHRLSARPLISIPCVCRIVWWLPFTSCLTAHSTITSSPTCPGQTPSLPPGSLCPLCSQVRAVTPLLLSPGKWLNPFDHESTEVNTFYLDKYQAVKVPMMYRAGKFATTFDKSLRCHVLQLPYQGNATMLVVVSEKVGEHLTLEDFLTTALVEEWLRNMKTRYCSAPARARSPSSSSVGGR